MHMHTPPPQVARSLEDPFVHPPNDLPAQAMQSAFNQRLISSMDALRVPADTAAAAARDAQMQRGMGVSGAGSELGCDIGSELELWGRFAALEPSAVRLASEELLQEWRRGGFDGRKARRALGVGEAASLQTAAEQQPPLARGGIGGGHGRSARGGSEAPTLELLPKPLSETERL